MPAVETHAIHSFVNKCGEALPALDQQAVSEIAQLQSSSLFTAAFDKRCLSTRLQPIGRESSRCTTTAPRMAGQSITRRGVAHCDDDTEAVTLQIT
jgi:hypothetical protein